MKIRIITPPSAHRLPNQPCISCHRQIRLRRKIMIGLQTNSGFWLPTAG